LTPVSHLRDSLFRLVAEIASALSADNANEFVIFLIVRTATGGAPPAVLLPTELMEINDFMI
jgi:hypothetical protein